MRPPKKGWSDSKLARSTLFFAQLVQEFIDSSSFESFRVHSLDTLSRAEEAIAVCGQVLAGRIPPDTLQPVIDELRVSISGDYVSKDIATSAHDNILHHLDSNQKPDALALKASLLYYVRNLKPSYQVALELHIIRLITNGDNKDLKNITNQYISFLINSGISTSQLDIIVKTEILEKSIFTDYLSSVVRFFSETSLVSKRFYVYISVNFAFGQYLTGSDIAIVPASQLPHGAHGRFANEPHSDRSLSRISIYAPDHHSAAAKAEQQLVSARSLTMLAPRVLDCSWDDESYVCEFGMSGGVLIQRQPPFSIPDTVDSLTIPEAKSFRRRTNRTVSIFDEVSIERLLSATNTVTLASSSFDPETQIISLWSAFEILLPHPVSGVRILHYEKLLTPSICLRHVRRKFAAVYDRLAESYKRPLKRLVYQVYPDERIDHHTRFIMLLILPEFKWLRDKLLIVLSNNPSALNRVSGLHYDFKTPQDWLNSIIEHENRVRWQVHRIYRTRNNLVHSGKLPTYMRGLVMDAYNYFRHAAGNIVRYTDKEFGPQNIDQTISELGFRYEASKRLLKSHQKDKEFNRSIIEKLVL